MVFFLKLHFIRLQLQLTPPPEVFSVCSVCFPPCLRRIYTYHCEFFDKLENRLVNWSEFSTIADLFSHLFEAADEHSQV